MRLEIIIFFHIRENVRTERPLYDVRWRGHGCPIFWICSSPQNCAVNSEKLDIALWTHGANRTLDVSGWHVPSLRNENLLLLNRKKMAPRALWFMSHVTTPLYLLPSGVFRSSWFNTFTFFFTFSSIRFCRVLFWSVFWVEYLLCFGGLNSSRPYKMSGLKTFHARYMSSRNKSSDRLFL